MNTAYNDRTLVIYFYIQHLNSIMVRKIKPYKLFKKPLICLLRVLLVVLWLFDDIILTISLPHSSTCVCAR